MSIKTMEEQSPLIVETELARFVCLITHIINSKYRVMKKFIYFSIALLLFTVFVGCSKDDDELVITSSKNVELTSKGTSQITCSDSKATYSSEDEYVATVSENGLITGFHIGETYIDVNGEKAVKVTVNPVYTSFTEPQFLFGATKDEVISKVGSNYASATSSVIGYVPTSGKVKAYFYFLKDGKVSAVGMSISTAYMESITNFLLERYIPATISDEDYTALFINGLGLDKTTMIIGEQIYSVSLINVIYMPYVGTKSRSAEEKQEYIQQMNEALKQLNLK